MMSTLPWNNDLTHLQSSIQPSNPLTNLALQFSIPRGTKPLAASLRSTLVTHRSKRDIAHSLTLYHRSQWSIL